MGSSLSNISMTIISIWGMQNDDGNWSVFFLCFFISWIRPRIHYSWSMCGAIFLMQRWGAWQNIKFWYANCSSTELRFVQVLLTSWIYRLKTKMMQRLSGSFRVIWNGKETLEDVRRYSFQAVTFIFVSDFTSIC